MRRVIIIVSNIHAAHLVPADLPQVG